MEKITTWLWFDTEAEEAAEFYTSVFPDSRITSVSYYGEAGPREVDSYWSRLADGGQEIACGWVTDRYGVAWQIVPSRLRELLGDPDPVRAQRVMAAMLKLTKIEVDELERAAAA